jgi:hypothetical protein
MDLLHMRRWLSCFSGILLCLFIGISSLQAQPGKVINQQTSREYFSLQEAIDGAGSGQTLLLRRLDPHDSEPAIFTGGFFITKSIKLEGEGEDLTKLDGEGKNIVLNIFGDSADKIEIRDLTIQNGMTKLGGGGGIFNLIAQLDLIRVKMKNNVSAYGGAIANVKGVVNISNSSIINNFAKTGGGIANARGTFTVNTSSISNNIANAAGGIINGSGTFNIIESSIMNNVSKKDGGGGIINGSGRMNITHQSLIHENKAQHNGGGIKNFGELSIDSSKITENTAIEGVGGGIFNDSETPLIRNSEIERNQPDNIFQSP